MPIHDWSRVEAGIFHDFHHAWIEEIKRALNEQILPEDYYALAEQHAAGFGPDVLTLQSVQPDDVHPQTEVPNSARGATVLLSAPNVRATAETDMEFYRRKQTVVAVRHVSGDEIVAMIEVVSPGNKSSRHGIRSFVEKAAELLDRRIHLLILDLNTPSKRDPEGIHGLIWEEISGQEYSAPTDKPLTLVAYEAGLTVRAFVEPVAVGDILAEMPLFLDPGAHVLVPLEATYGRAMAALPRRWRVVVEGNG